MHDYGVSGGDRWSFTFRVERSELKSPLIYMPQILFERKSTFTFISKDKKPFYAATLDVDPSKPPVVTITGERGRGELGQPVAVGTLDLGFPFANDQKTWSTLIPVFVKEKKRYGNFTFDLWVQIQ